jgi:hypothetical protein
LTTFPTGSFSEKDGATSQGFLAREAAPEAISSAVTPCIVSMAERGTL